MGPSGSVRLLQAIVPRAVQVARPETPLYLLPLPLVVPLASVPARTSDVLLDTAPSDVLLDTAPCSSSLSCFVSQRLSLTLSGLFFIRGVSHGLRPQDLFGDSSFVSPRSA